MIRGASYGKEIRSLDKSHIICTYLTHMNKNKELGIFFKKVIPQFVRQRRKLKLSQGSVDDILGCAKGLVSKWEVGIRKPSGFLFCCWADSLKCDLKIEERKEKKKLK